MIPGPGSSASSSANCLRAIVARGDLVADIGPVEPRQHQAFGRNAELGEDIGAGMRIRRRRQRQARHLREGVHQRAELAIIGAEIVAPFGNAMRLVHREQRDLCAGEHVTEPLLAGAFGGDIEQIELPRAERIHRLAPVGIDAGERGGSDAVRPRAAQLIVHQRDQRGNHHAGAVEHGGRKLVGERFARAGRHHRQRRLPRQHPRQHILLHPAKFGKAENAAQFGSGLIEIGRQGCGIIHRRPSGRSHQIPPPARLCISTRIGIR